MTANTAPEASAPETKKSRIGTIVRWAARLTSLPVLAMVLVSLIPALGTFAISAKDDRIIALGLGGTCVGLLAGWKWTGLGGAVIVLSVVVMLTQGDSFFSPDQYSVAFGLQGILFLVSGMLNCGGGKATAPPLGWARKAGLALLVFCALAGVATLVRGPGSTPVPKERDSFIGVWDNGAGFTLEITADGHARINQTKESKVAPWNSPLAQGGTGVFQANFRGDERLELTTGLFGSAKTYNIDREPYPQGGQSRMILNGSDPYKPGAGIVLTKKPVPPAPAPAAKKN